MNGVTLCITMGRRPDLLRQTLSALLEHAQFDAIIAINDFRDDETNQAFKEMCPDGRLISLDRQLGHHGAVDLMYGLVSTPWVFHCEDDLLFEKPIDLQRLIGVLKSDPTLSAICLRQRSDFYLKPEDDRKVRFESHGGLNFFRLYPVHEQWHGYSFNPHLASVDLWRSVGPFSKFKKERHISRTIRKMGLTMPYWADGGCTHLGANDSVSYPVVPKKPFWKRWLRL